MKREVSRTMSSYYNGKGDGVAVTVWMDREMIDALHKSYEQFKMSGWENNSNCIVLVKDILAEAEARCDG